MVGTCMWVALYLLSRSFSFYPYNISTKLISKQRKRSQHEATKCSSELSRDLSKGTLLAVLESELRLGSYDTKDSALPEWFSSVTKLVTEPAVLLPLCP